MVVFAPFGRKISFTIIASFLFTLAFSKPARAWTSALEMSSSPLDLSSTSDSTTPRHVVIVGAGIVGTATAYYLAEHFKISSSIIDSSGQIAPAASGKAGGFLALDWNDHSPVGPLARRSFQLHQELADTLGADKLQYRRLTCAAISVDDTSNVQRPSAKKLEQVEWAQTVDDENILGDVRQLGDESTIAQVHPKKLCEALWEVASKPKGEGGVGSTFVTGKATKIIHDEGNGAKLVGVQLESGEIIKGDAVLIAAGPWTANVMTGVKYHSVLIPTPRDRSLSQCVFFSGCGDPEVYVRPDQTAYCCGFPDTAIKVTETPGHEEVRPAAVHRIVSAVRQASGNAWNDAEPIVQSSCYLPTTPDNLPIMGRLPSPSCYIATGHSCWGILMGPATGESMASLIAAGETMSSQPVHLDSFSPDRFRNMRVLE